MSAPQIPNLNTLRRGGGGLRGRLRGRGRGGSSGGAGDDSTSQEENNNAKNAARKDQIVQNTDNDASVSRLSAVDLGYLNDPFARSLTPSGGGPGSRRFPIINRGIVYEQLSEEL
jgi:[phosphatase 2A protein]-leucine-carboxy methyltransferase